MSTPNDTPIFNFSVPQGTDYTLNIEFQNPDTSPQNLTGFSFRCQARLKYGAPLLFEPIVTVLNQAVPANLGKATLYISRAMTQPLDPKVIDVVYDVEEIAPSTQVRRRFQGSITIYPEATLDA